MGNRTYTRVFNDEGKSDLAIKLLNDGFSFSFIGNLLGCHRSSVNSFKKRKEKEGFTFKKVGNKLDVTYNRFHKTNKSRRIKPNYFVEFERAFDKKKSYKDYLADAKKREKGRKQNFASRMRQAKQNLKEAHLREKKELKK